MFSSTILYTFKVNPQKFQYLIHGEIKFFLPIYVTQFAINTLTFKLFYSGTITTRFAVVCCFYTFSINQSCKRVLQLHFVLAKAHTSLCHSHFHLPFHRSLVISILSKHRNITISATHTCKVLFSRGPFLGILIFYYKKYWLDLDPKFHNLILRNCLRFCSMVRVNSYRRKAVSEMSSKTLVWGKLVQFGSKIHKF